MRDALASGPVPREFVLRGATVLDASGRRRADVAVRDGLIAAVGADLAGGAVLDASGCVITPGLVDLDVGVGEPGHEETETVATAARAAALGGYTTIVARADTDPVVDGAAAVKELLALGVGACCRVLPSATVTVGAAGERLSPMAELAALGVRLFSDDGAGIADARLLRRALEYAAGLDVVVAQVPEDRALAAGGQLHEGEWSSRLGMAGIPAEAEEVVVMRDLALVRLTGGRLHFRPLSTAASWAMVASARRGGLAVSAEAALPHLLLDHSACAGFDPATKFRPPLRPAEDRDAAVGVLAAGGVDALVGGHLPHSIEDKEVPFDEAVAGASALEWTLALALTHLVLHEDPAGAGAAGGVPLAELVAALSWRPAAVLAPTSPTGTAGRTSPYGTATAGIELAAGLGAGRVEPGAVADLAVIDPTVSWTLDPARGASRTRTTPFAGRPLRGRVRHTILRGEPVVVDAVAQR